MELVTSAGENNTGLAAGGKDCPWLPVQYLFLTTKEGTAMARKKKQFEKYFDHQWQMEKSSKHHILPSSRGGNGSKENISVINEDLHRRFHDLFSNRTPHEVVEFLVEYFFAGDYHILMEVLNKKEAQYYGYYE